MENVSHGMSLKKLLNVRLKKRFFRGYSINSIIMVNIAQYFNLFQNIYTQLALPGR
jgi:hypothetical protein